jgi:hypothetical protein
MAYALAELSIETTIGPPFRIEGNAFVNARVYLEFSQGNGLPNVTIDIRIPMTYTEESTVREIQESAALAVKDLMAAAGTGLAGFDAAGIRQLSVRSGDHSEQDATARP